ncbi:AmmeMemoRadiSam system protein B [Thiomicrorhabdus sp. Kp2]|uniref:AmmeMemoRadiSam system protein B n=1 Tax=Thiomicrorhabdus sp. Kp2 TaxID=1123518 RepID=UPI0003FF9A11|nr:AmmeMemoRadiSam system protein B [Thiomicrorhabdus sp. Kp2]
MNVRQPAVAGLFYPNSASEILHFMESCQLALAEQVELERKEVPRALILPHAGYVYSGYAAYQGVRLWQNHEQIKTVVIIGPAHRVAFEGVATISSEAMATPLGNCEVDSDLRTELIDEFDFISVSDFAHAQEHSLEVELPFIQKIIPDAKVLPLLNGRVSAQEVAQLVSYLWKREGVYFIISSDLSHFHSYEIAKKIDQKTAEMIDVGDWQALNGERACGYLGIQGVLKYISENLPGQNVNIERVALLNSGDTAGDKERVVGYGAWAIYEDGKGRVK